MHLLAREITTPIRYLRHSKVLQFVSLCLQTLLKPWKGFPVGQTMTVNRTDAALVHAHPSERDKMCWRGVGGTPLWRRFSPDLR